MDRLQDESKAVAQIAIRAGAPRLIVNGVERFPLLAWSWDLPAAVRYFKQAGLQILHPILGLNEGWLRPGCYEWQSIESVFAQLLENHSEAYFLPRVLFDVPLWWKERYPQELVQTALPVQPYRPVRRNPHGGWLWGIQSSEPSLGSDRYLAEMQLLFGSFLQFIENSSLANRVIGYQLGGGIYGEWHYSLSAFLPDFNPALAEKIGPAPDLQARTQSTFGLLRDPQHEQEVIDYYWRFHDYTADVLLSFARQAKEVTGRRVLCGAFYGYQLENVWMQEGGHLAPEKILSSADIDFIASPYSYQTTNLTDRQWWEHDVVDGAGNALGRARGIAGDGGYRVLLESLRRHGKLYFAELDASTFIEPPPVNPDGSGAQDVDREFCMIGGDGCTEVDGSLKIVERDLAQVLAKGAGGWLFDFGPVLRSGKSWYSDPRLIELVRAFQQWGESRSAMQLDSVAEIAAVYDAKTFAATRHWRADMPFTKGGENLDYFMRWFMDSQARALHRIGAPVDFLYHFDLQSKDLKRHKLWLMVNLFYLQDEQVKRLHRLAENSGITVVWYYAPALLRPDRIDLERMQALTGFHFQVLDEPGSMLIQTTITASDWKGQMVFGVDEQRWPRFAVQDNDADIWGVWQDNGLAAFACKTVQGYHSVYLGSAPLPAHVLRWLAVRSGAQLWSSEPDLVMASRDVVATVAESPGRRTISLPYDLYHVRSTATDREFTFAAEYGQVDLFVRKL
ncbi:MAG TPA: hypothetical protein PKW76_14850 [bacterium]|nr:hypothetical protein [bacterium]HPG46953.1 hypothetical protein [bacterium]HPM99317.1 hypothetical protein [bacterium]